MCMAALPVISCDVLCRAALLVIRCDVLLRVDVQGYTAGAKL